MAIPKECINTNSTNDLKSAEETQICNKKIFVGGLHHLLQEKEMKEYFEQFGQVSVCVIMHDKATRKSRGKKIF